MMTDPVADMLTRIRNAHQAGHECTRVSSSKLKLAIARVLEEQGYLERVSVESGKVFDQLLLDLRYKASGVPIIEGIARVSRPSCRVYVNHDEVPKVRNGIGVAILSTSKGVMTDASAREANVGGEVLCEVW